MSQLDPKQIQRIINRHIREQLDKNEDIRVNSEFRTRDDIMKEIEWFEDSIADASSGVIEMEISKRMGTIFMRCLSSLGSA